MRGYTYISLRQAEYLLDAETYARFAEVAHRFFAANGELGRIDEVMITVPVGSVARAALPEESGSLAGLASSGPDRPHHASSYLDSPNAENITRARERVETEIELWPETGESEDDFMDRCISELEVCIGDRAGAVCEDKWDASKELGKKGFVTLSMLNGDLAIAPCGTSCLGCQGVDAREWDESKHPRGESGPGTTPGSFTDSGGGGGGGDTAPAVSGDDSKKDGKNNYGLVPGDVEKYHALKGEWGKLNNQFLKEDEDGEAPVDNPTGPKAKALLSQMETLCKEMNGLHADPGGPGGIGLPGGPRDVLIVGAGPAGLSAAINGAAEGLDTMLVEASLTPGGQAKFSSRVENLGGYPVGVRGKRLMQNNFAQAQRLGAETKLGIRVTGMTVGADGMKHVTLSNGEKIESRTVIIAGGVEFIKLPFDGSEGPGVVIGDPEQMKQAAKGAPVVVIGGSNGGAQAALDAAETAERVYLLSRSPIADNMSDYVISGVRNNPKITVIENDEIVKLWRDEHGEPQMVETKGGQKLPAKAVGVFVGSVPKTDWVPAEIKRVEEKGPNRNKLRVKRPEGEESSNYETVIPGVYVVGDMRAGGAGRIGAAIGDGQFSLRQANAFLEDQKEAAKTAAKADKPKKTIKKKPDDQWITDHFDIDWVNPWLGQTIEDVTSSDAAETKKLFDESKHPRVPAGEPGGGQFGEGGGGGGGGGGPEPLAAGDEPKGLLISERPGQEKLDLWNKQINDRQEELNQAGQTGEHEDDQLNQMSLALSAYSQEDQKHLDEERAGINVRYDLDNKLLAAAYTDIIKKPQGDVAKIAYFGTLDADAFMHVVNDLSERFGQKVNSIEVQRWKDDPSLPLWEQAGFKQREGQAGLTNLSAVMLEKQFRNTATAPSFENLPTPVSVSEGTGTDFQSEIRSALGQIPPRAMKTMGEEGITFKVGSRLTELNPELKGVHPRGWSAGTTWDSAEGMFSHEQKAVNIAEFYRPVGKKEFVRTDRTRGLVLHESGHGFDYALGRPSATSSAFIYAYTVDRKSIPKEARGPLRYFLQKGKAGRSETFAEIFGWQIERGSMRSDIRKYFPKTSELVKKAMLSGLWLEPVA
jgi:thioredoxin reductase